MHSSIIRRNIVDKVKQWTYRQKLLGRDFPDALYNNHRYDLNEHYILWSSECLVDIDQYLYNKNHLPINNYIKISFDQNHEQIVHNDNLNCHINY